MKLNQLFLIFAGINFLIKKYTFSALLNTMDLNMNLVYLYFKAIILINLFFFIYILLYVTVITIFCCAPRKNLSLKKNTMLMKVYLLFQTHLNLSILMIIGLNLSINTCIMVRQYSVLLTNCS